jgi:hypothetical protein
METAATVQLEEVIAEESANQLLREQARLKAERLQQLEGLRPGLLSLLRGSGFTLYACPQGYYVEYGRYRSVLTIEQLHHAAEQGGVAVLRLFEAVKVGGVATIDSRLFWVIVVLGQLFVYSIFRVSMEWHPLNFLQMQALLLTSMLVAIVEAYPKLTAYRPWKWLKVQERREPKLKLI